MREWHKPSGVAATSYLPAELDRAYPLSHLGTSTNGGPAQAWLPFRLGVPASSPGVALCRRFHYAQQAHCQRFRSGFLNVVSS